MSFDKHKTVDVEAELGDKEAYSEACAILHSMKNGVNFSDVLSIQPNVMAALLAFKRQFPEDAWLIDRALKHRKRVNLHLRNMLREAQNGSPNAN